MTFELIYKQFGASSILMEWPQYIDKAILNDILRFKSKIAQSDFSNIMTLNHAYASLLITYDVSNFDVSSEILKLSDLYQSADEVYESKHTLWKIPVCYDQSFGIDLELLSKEKRIDVDDVIKMHSQSVYTIYFIGFLPGFLYLGGLDEQLFTPRRATPRLKIEKGAVAIGGKQTGVYPSESPGGWNIIGNSPVHFFDVSKAEPCFAKAGDSLQFYPVTLKVYQDIQTLVDAGIYQIESEVLDG
ncbi:inhibitor of KinA [Hyunsoonleella jejuensis]|uniref:Inhibitor of KinA n=1 Tax=Hyunsoonleella jejuensis TaxID=419940 RepID=A0A1H9GU86_9FLAO|nr:5-oxoprolinase subunit PxpB [Hyunsoonleella jejuensis]SEQ53573.1 inhibitor of KinA [Hyunsoonleella jejuensis]